MATTRKAAPAKAPVRKSAAPRKAAPAKSQAPAARLKTPAPVKVPAPAVAAAAKPEKPRKPKLVRDSYTIPKPEYQVLEQLKQRAALAGAPAKKSELLRAGIKALAAMDERALLGALSVVPAIKTGRPSGT